MSALFWIGATVFAVVLLTAAFVVGRWTATVDSLPSETNTVLPSQWYSIPGVECPVQVLNVLNSHERRMVIYVPANMPTGLDAKAVTYATFVRTATLITDAETLTAAAATPRKEKP